MKTVRLALQVFLAGIAFAVYAEDLPSRFDWRNVDGKCYVTPVRGEDYGHDCSYAYAPMDCLESVRLLFCEQKGWNELDDATRDGMLFRPGVVASNIANAESKDGAYSALFNGAKYPCVTKSLDWMIRQPFGGRYVTNISFHDGIDPDYDPATGDEDLSGYWEAAIEYLKKNLREAPFMAGMQYVDEYERNGRYCFFPPYPKTEFLQPEYYRTVLVVGWDDSVSARKFSAEDQSPEGPGAWIVKASRGEGVGADGYFYVSFYDRSLLKMNEGWTFHLKDDLVTTVLDGMLDDGVQSYGAIYSYDLDSPSEFGMTYRDSYGIMFTADRDAVIGGIGIFDLTGRSYDIYARTGCQVGNPASGTLVLSGESVSNRLRAKGYNVYPLSEPFEVKKGQRFSIMVEGSGLAFIRKDDFVKGRYFHGSRVSGSEWKDIAITTEEEEYRDYRVPFITAYERKEGVSLHASDGDFIDLDGTLRTEYGVEVKWETTVKSGTPVYNLYRAPEGSGAFKLLKSGLKERRYVDLLTTCGGELEIDRKYDYKVVDTVHDIESNVNSGYAGTLPQLLYAEAARLWLVGEGPYNVRLEWNDYNSDAYAVPNIHFDLFGENDSSRHYKFDCTVDNAARPASRTVVNAAGGSFVRPGDHGKYSMDVDFTIRNRRNGNSKDGIGRQNVKVKVYFNKYKRESGKNDLANWFHYWPKDGAIDSSYFADSAWSSWDRSQWNGKFYYSKYVADSNKGLASTILCDGTIIDENVFPMEVYIRKKKCERDFRVCQFNPKVQYYLSDFGAAKGAVITHEKFSGYTGPDIGQDSIGLQKVADTIEHEMRHGELFTSLFKDRLVLARAINPGKRWNTCTAWRNDWTEWAKRDPEWKYPFLLQYTDRWAVDSDGDCVSDAIEGSLIIDDPRAMMSLALDPSNPDTLGLKAYNEKAYSWCGDNELLARLEEAKTKVSINPRNDWAFPGCNIGVNFQGHSNADFEAYGYPYWHDSRDSVKKALVAAFESDGTPEPVPSRGVRLQARASGSSQYESGTMEDGAELSSEAWDDAPDPEVVGIVSVGNGEGRNPDDSGQFEYLVFPFAVTNLTDLAEACVLTGILADENGRAVAWASARIDVPAQGTAEDELRFDGMDISVRNFNSCSLVNVVLQPVESNMGETYDELAGPFETTEDYSCRDFVEPNVMFDRSYVYGEYLDDYGLRIECSVYKKSPANILFVANLSATNGETVARYSKWLSGSGWKNSNMTFSRDDLSYSGIAGPFVVSLVQFLDGDEVVCGARDVYTTQEYSLDQLQSESAHLLFDASSFRCRVPSRKMSANIDFTVSSDAAYKMPYKAIAVVRGVDGEFACAATTNVVLTKGTTALSLSVPLSAIDPAAKAPYSVSELIFTPLSYGDDRQRFFPPENAFSLASGGGGSDPISEESGTCFSASAVEVFEGEVLEIGIRGGNADSVSSVKVYLTYNTAAATDVDLAKGAIDGVVPKGGLKFPLTLNWKAGEVGEKVIRIPVKKDTVVEMDEFFTLQLADTQGMELGEDRVCTVTIHDPGYDELAAKIKAGTATKAEQTTWDKLQKAKSPYVCALADPANAGTAKGSGLYAAGKKVTLKATANKGYVFAGWTAREESAPSQAEGGVLALLNGQDARSPSVSFVMLGEDVALMAIFATTAEDAESLKIAVADMTTEADGSIGTLGSDGTRSFDLGACVTSLSLPKLAVSGLPAGLKFDAKTNKILGRATKPGVYAVTVKATNASVTKATDATTATFKLTVPNFACGALPGLLADADAYGMVRVGVAFGADRINCTPEKDWSVNVAGLPAGLKYDAKSGKIIGIPTAKPGAYTVTFTATKKGEANQIATITLNVGALPDWAVGTFTGYVKPGDYGLATMTVAANGKISGKIQHGGTNWTFKADSFSRVEHIERVDEISISIETNFVINVVATAGKAKREMELHVTDGSGGRGATALPGMINAKVEGATEDGAQTFSLWRTIWKDKATADAAKRTLAEWEGTYNVSLGADENSGYGSGYLSLAVGKDGNVKATGKLADGTSISATSPLMYDAEHGYFILVYAAPSAYMGGSFALSISFDAPKGALGNSVEVSKWSSRNPQATGEYGEGFARWVSFFGSYYDKNASLTNFYDRLTFELAELPLLVASCKRTYYDENDRKVTETQQGEAAPVYLLSQDGLTVSVNAKGTGFDVLKATKPVQDKITKRWNYPGPNDGGLTLTFDPKTGILKGTYTFWYDYLSVNDEIAGKETWAHTSKKVSFEGLMVQGESPRGFYLREESSSYADSKTGKPKTYKYKSSHGIHFTSPDSGWRRLNSEGEWRYSVSVRRGDEHTFWVDSLSPGTSVMGIDVEGSYTYLKDGEEHEVLVGASQGGVISDKDGNLTGFFVTLTTDDWFVDEYTPKNVKFKVTVDGFYDESTMINNKFKFHHVRGKGAFPNE